MTDKKGLIKLYDEDDVDDFYFFYEVIKAINPKVECINTGNGVDTMEYIDNAIAYQ